MRTGLLAGFVAIAMAASATAQAPIFPTRSSDSASYANTDTPTRTIGDAIEEMTAERILMAPKVWASGEYQILWTQNANTPPLIVRVPAQFNPNSANTFLDSQKINEFPGKRDLKYDSLNGFRVSAGVRIQPQLAIDGNYFSTERVSREDTFAGSGLPGMDGIAREYIQAGTGSNISLFAALPGQYSGFVSAKTDLRTWGLDSNVRWDSYHFFVDRSELMAGFRYFELSENLSIHDSSTFGDGSRLTVSDSFQSRNQFYGGQVGMHSRIYGTVWSIDFINKYAIGGVRQEVRAVGSNSIFSPAGVESQEAGGLYARGANIGTFNRNRFAVMGESAILLGYNVTQNCRLHFGYNATWISSVIRATEVIDPTVNDQGVRYITQTSQSTSKSPVFQWNRASDFYVQGLTFGVTIGY